MKHSRTLLALFATLLAVLQTMLALTPSVAQAASQPAGRLVSDDPAAFTPHVLDGSVYAIAQVGNTIVLGGSFTQVRNNSGTTTTLSRSRLVAFDATTGTISTTFLPNPNGTINAVIPAADGTSVYVGGSFSSIGGVSAKNLARVRVSDGAVLTTFNGGSPSGVVKDLKLAGGHLWVAGAFTHIRGQAQPALATLDPDTGVFQTYFSGVIAGVHKNGSFTNVYKMDVSPDGTKLAAVGNFDTLNGVKNHQLLVLDLGSGAATPANYQTGFYEAGCSSSFDTYMRDVDFAPDSSFFVVGTTGAYGGSSGPCDTTARWDLSQSGSGLQPSWVNYTGGDTTYSVEVTSTAVYVGGHQRWQNNPYAGDAAGAGSVSRPGIAALNPVNGIPFSWNPTRDRGVGVFDFLSTSQGLWVGSDTDRIGNYEYHAKIALFPAAGTTVPAVSTAPFPNDVYSAGALGFASDPSVLYRVNAGGGELSASKGIDWAADPGNNVYSTAHNTAAYGDVSSVDSTVPAGTPSAIFNSEAWDDSGAPEMTWSFPVAAGTPVQVRLYFANRYDGTSQTGQRVYNVAIDGTSFLNNFDIVAAVGHNVGTMRSKDITSDGSVDISFGHITENPLVNGIEIIQTNVPAAASGSLSKRSFNGTVAGASTAVADGGVDWDTVRGGFMINGYLYTALSDGSFVRRSFNGTSFGAAQSVNGQDAIVVLQEWKNDASSATGMFYDSGRIYYTLSGSSNLYYRYLNVESGIVGAQRLTASSGVDGIDFSKVRGMFLGGSKLYWATVDGTLHAIDWNDGPISGTPVAGSASAVSGPGVDGQSWSARAMFLYQDSNGDGAGQPPVAAFTLSCSDNVNCDVDASATTVAGATITSYAWNWGDGTQTSGKTSSHSYTADGLYTVTLTVTSSKGATSVVTQQVNVSLPNTPPVATFTASCELLVCIFDAGDSSDDSAIAGYSWNFGDGTGTGQVATHTFTAAGEHEVTLTVTDDEGESAEFTDTVTPVDTPTADFSVACDSLACSFDASGSVTPGSTVDSYSWDFGDDDTGSGKKPDHTYGSADTYQVTLTIETPEGLTDSVTKDVEVVRTNQAPTAAFSVDCEQLVCSFDASGSTDPDGSVDSYQWDFGDGDTATGRTPDHTFDADDTYQVTLTVTDNEGKSSDPVSKDIEVSAAAVTFVSANSANGNKTSHVVRIPNQVNAGDQLLLFFTGNATTATITGPAGWTQVRSTDGNGYVGRMWAKTATAADAGANVTVALSGYLKGDLTVAAYRSTSGSVVIANSAAATASGATSVTTPQLALGSGSLVVDYVGAKASSSLTANLPNALTQRASSSGGGSSGAVYAWLADSGDYLSGGQFGGQQVSFSASANRVLVYAVSLRVA